MFRTSRRLRSFRQNLLLAVFLSTTAGLVNSIGLLSLGVLTTNVTGHFAFLAESLTNPTRYGAADYLLFILSFFAGALLSGCLSVLNGDSRNFRNPDAGIVIEMIILTAVGVIGDAVDDSAPHRTILAAVLLLAMGLQNGLVTAISKATIRTTHLTGLLTDLGIDLAKWIGNEKNGRGAIAGNIQLRLLIIAFFTSGCVAGAALTRFVHFKGLLVGVLILLFALQYDNIRIGYYRARKRYSRSV